MTNEQAIEILDDNYTAINTHGHYTEEEEVEALQMAIKALERDNNALERVEDCINRAWLKEAIHNFYYGLKHTPTEEDIQAYIDVAPPVTPKQRTGRCVWCSSPFRIEYYWIDCDGNTASFADEDKHIVATGIAKFCPNCGAKMEEQA